MLCGAQATVGTKPSSTQGACSELFGNESAYCEEEGAAAAAAEATSASKIPWKIRAARKRALKHHTTGMTKDEFAQIKQSLSQSSITCESSLLLPIYQTALEIGSFQSQQSQRTATRWLETSPKERSSSSETSFKMRTMRLRPPLEGGRRPLSRPDQFLTDLQTTRPTAQTTATPQTYVTTTWHRQVLLQCNFLLFTFVLLFYAVC